MEFVITENVFTVPSAPVLNTPPTVTDTAITTSGSVPDDSVVTKFVVKWQRDTSIGCSDMDHNSITNISDSFTEHTITGLEPGNKYTINVTVLNGAGSSPISNSVTAMTREKGEREIPVVITVITVSLYTVPSSGPNSVKKGTVTASSITLHWGEVPCLHRNGQITGYEVEAVRNGVVKRSIDVSSDTREATVSGLSPSTSYTVQVAAVNGAGTGPYSTGIDIWTNGT